MGYLLPALAVGILQSSGSIGNLNASVDLYPGDVVTVASAVDPLFSFCGVVNRAGIIRTPLGLPVKAIGPDGEVIDALGSVLERESGRSLKPLIWRVSRKNSFRVDGAVRWSGSVRIKAPISVAELMIAVQPDPVSDLSAATATRGQETLPLEALGGIVKTGDRLFFPTRDASANVAVVGAVVRPSTVSLENGLTIEKCLQLVGGIALHGNLDQVEIWTKGSMLEAVKAGSFATRTLKRGESIRVPRAESVFSVTVTSFAGTSQVVEVRDGIKLSEVLKATGAKPTLADGYVTVRGMNRDKPPFKGRFSEILTNPLADVFLSKGDAILIE